MGLYSNLNSLVNSAHHAVLKACIAGKIVLPVHGITQIQAAEEVMVLTWRPGPSADRASGSADRSQPAAYGLQESDQRVFARHGAVDHLVHGGGSGRGAAGPEAPGAAVMLEGCVSPCGGAEDGLAGWFAAMMKLEPSAVPSRSSPISREAVIIHFQVRMTQILSRLS